MSKLKHINGRYFEYEYEEAVIQLLEKAGWDYTGGADLPNRRLDQALIEDDLRLFIARHYADRQLSADEIGTIIARLRNEGGPSDYEAVYNTFKLYHEGFNFTYSDKRFPAFHFDYIDYGSAAHNIFRVVNQLEMVQGNENRRPDVMLYINGIPVCIFELKNPVDTNATIRDAHTQITVRYRRDIMNLLKYCVLAVISDGSNTRLGNIFANYEFFYAWKKVNNEDKATKGVEELRTLIEGALSTERIIDILRDFIYFPDLSDKSLSKETEIICRYPQFFAARRLFGNILQHLRSCGGDGKGGVYFGATGCGKTYTMLYLARLLALRNTQQLGSPTILIIVDREDLERQTGEKLFQQSIGFLCNGDVRTFESREDLGNELRSRNQGGVFITTIQKFTSATGLLSERSNIICISDEAHRTQNNTGSTLKIVDNSKECGEGKELNKDASKLGAFITYGFAKYLRDALPNATYVGFTGTPIDETIRVFGGVVDSYSMRQAREDGITVDIIYDPRLVHVNLDKQQSDQIEAYYRQCEEEGANPDDVDKSKRIMSSLNEILGNPDRLDRMARDIIAYYDKRVETQPEMPQKAMIVCSSREIAFALYNKILLHRPQWGEKVKSLEPERYTTEQLSKMEAMPFLNIVATRDRDDVPQMYNLLGDKEHRKELDAKFKEDTSNFRIAIVVDMWITGFDVPNLTMMFNDKPLQKHTLIQTISRVNRKYSNIVLDDDGNILSGDTKRSGVVVDYIGIHANLQQAMKKYGGDDNSFDSTDIDLAYQAFLNELKRLKQITYGFDFTPFFGNEPLKRLLCLQNAVEFLLELEQTGIKYDGVKVTTSFRQHVKRLKAAYNICNPAGILTDEEVAWTQCFMGICSYLSKISDSHHDVESMNKVVEQMVMEALSSGGIETIFDPKGEIDIYSDDFLKELDDVKLPCTKFELLVKLLRRAIREYSKTNKTRAEHYTKLLEETLKEYHSRDNYAYVSGVAKETVTPMVNDIENRISQYTERIKDIFTDLKADRLKFKSLGITFEEQAFYDILIEVRDANGFEYSDKRCKELSRKIKTLIDESSMYADWLNNSKVRNALATDLTKLLYHEGYPPRWDGVIFEKVLSQVENFKNNE